MPRTIDRFDGNYWFLSNFYEADIEVIRWGGNELLVWPSVEHYFQAQKTTDIAEQDRIRGASSAGISKKMGRAVNLRPDWDAIKIPVMRRALNAKFAPDSILGALLLNTEDALLIEGNTWGDKFWGVCDYQGDNWLGWLLMAQRSYLRSILE